jgi:hypothetical protein
MWLTWQWLQPFTSVSLLSLPSPRVQSCAGWSERHREDIEAALQRHTSGGCSEVVWRPSAQILKEEGLNVQVGGQLLLTAAGKFAAAALVAQPTPAP